MNSISETQRRITASFEESLAVKRSVLDTLLPQIATVAEWMTATLTAGNKLLLFGNGGSAADSQHIAAEFIGRFEKERRAWPAIALTTDTSILTALGNDYSVEIIFARQIEALGRAGDLAIAITTSGNSPNVIAGVEAARKAGMRSVGLTGQSGGKLIDVCDLTLCVPSKRTARIQESHITICHVLCEVVESTLPVR